MQSSLGYHNWEEWTEINVRRVRQRGFRPGNTVTWETTSISPYMRSGISGQGVSAPRCRIDPIVKPRRPSEWFLSSLRDKMGPGPHPAMQNGGFRSGVIRRPDCATDRDDDARDLGAPQICRRGVPKESIGHFSRCSRGPRRSARSIRDTATLDAGQLAIEEWAGSNESAPARSRGQLVDHQPGPQKICERVGA